MTTISRKLQSESRTQQIISLVARRGPMTVAELVKALGVTTTAVRQQINRLMWEGWLIREQRRTGLGRPADLFSLSEQAKRSFANELDDFARELVQEIVETDGREKLQLLLRRVSQRMTRHMESQAGGGRPAERINKLVRLLRHRGTVADVQPSEVGLKLNVFTCPFHGLGEARREICEVERSALGRMAGGGARLERSMQAGDGCCEFTLALEPAGGPADEQTE